MTSVLLVEASARGASRERCAPGSVWCRSVASGDAVPVANAWRARRASYLSGSDARLRARTWASARDIRSPPDLPVIRRGMLPKNLESRGAGICGHRQLSYAESLVDCSGNTGSDGASRQMVMRGNSGHPQCNAQAADNNASRCGVLPRRDSDTDQT